MYKSHCIGADPKSSDWCHYEKTGGDRDEDTDGHIHEKATKCHTHTHTREGHVKETKTNDAAASPGMPKAAGSHLRLQRSNSLQRKHGPADPLISNISSAEL